ARLPHVAKPRLRRVRPPACECPQNMPSAWFGPQTNQCRQTRPFTGPWESCDSIRQEHALDQRREALGTLGYVRPRSHRDAGWSDNGANGGDVVVWAGPRAVAEFGQRRRLRDPNRLYIDPGSGPATGTDGAVAGCQPHRLFRPHAAAQG